VDVLPPDFAGIVEIVGGVAEEGFPSRRGGDKKPP